MNLIPYDIVELNETNYIQYCMKHYDNPQCHTIKEFEEDLNRLLYLQKLFYRYTSNNDLRERLILNHLIVLFNVFNNHTINILFYKIDEKYWNVLVTFLIYLNRMPASIPKYGIVSSNYTLDNTVITSLRNI